MKDILENSLIMAILGALVWIPMFMVKRKNEKQKVAYIQQKLGEIASHHHLIINKSNQTGNLLLVWTENRQLLMIHLIDYNYQIIDCEKIIQAQDQIVYNGKEIKSVGLKLVFPHQEFKEITLYKQYENSESELSKAIKLAAEWSLLLTPTASP